MNDVEEKKYFKMSVEKPDGKLEKSKRGDAYNYIYNKCNFCFGVKCACCCDTLKTRCVAGKAKMSMSW